MDAVDANTINVEQQTFGELDEDDEQEPRTRPVNRARRCFRTDCNNSATTLVGCFGGSYQEGHGTLGAVTLVWRCNSCTVVMHTDNLNLRHDRRQAPRLLDSLEGPIQSSGPNDVLALTSGIDINFVENNLMNMRNRDNHLEGDNVMPHMDNWPMSAPLLNIELV